MSSQLLAQIIVVSQVVSCAYGSPLGPIDADQVASTIRATWKNPSDTMTILLIIGGDTVRQALAQLSGSHIVPVAFSFGWIAYSFNALVSVVGSGRLMPSPDYDATLINASNGFARNNRSWVLGRLLRDFEHPMDSNIGLRVVVFRASSHVVPYNDWYWISGIAIIVVQLLVATIPCVLYGNWGTLLITGAGTILALLTGALPQWRFEKWACRRIGKKQKIFCLTGGNGSRNVMVIIGSEGSLDLEDLAAAESPRLLRRTEHRTTHTLMDLPLAFRITQIACAGLSVLWIVLLITVTGLEQNSWYLLLVGSLGMVQNAAVAGARREPGASGIHLTKDKEFTKESKVMHVLMDVERDVQGVGKALLPVFFPGSLRKLEEDWWKGDRDGYDQERAKAAKADVKRQQKVECQKLTSDHSVPILPR